MHRPFPPTLPRPLRRTTLIAALALLPALAAPTAFGGGPAKAVQAPTAGSAKAKVRTAAVGDELVTNGSFEQGKTGWKANKPNTTTLTIVRAGKAGDAIRMRTDPVGIGVLNDAENSVQSSPKGTTYHVSAWVRSNRAKTGGHLRVSEAAGGNTRTHQKWFWLKDKAWHQVKFTFTSELARSELGVNVLGYELSPTRRLVIDEVSLKVATEGLGDGETAGQLTNGCAYNRRGIPACGAYLGGAHGANSDPAGWEDDMNHRLGVRRTYWRADQVGSAVSTAASDLAHQRLPWISFKLPYSWTEMANGRGDAWARDLANRLKALNGPVWVAFHHEPEGDGNVQEWKRMQKRLAPIVRGTAPNVGYTIILTGWNQLYGPPQFHLSELWPDTTIDVAGFDVFQSYGQVKNGKMITKIVDLKTKYFAPLAQWAEQEGVAWGLAETGYSDIAPNIWPDWPQEKYQDLVDLGGVAFSYFDTDLHSTASWDLGDTPIKVSAYAEAIQGTPNLPDIW